MGATALGTCSTTSVFQGLPREPRTRRTTLGLAVTGHHPCSYFQKPTHGPRLHLGELRSLHLARRLRADQHDQPIDRRPRDGPPWPSGDHRPGAMSVSVTPERAARGALTTRHGSITRVPPGSSSGGCVGTAGRCADDLTRRIRTSPAGQEASPDGRLSEGRSR